VGRRVVLSLVGTRPNFMKIAPIQAALARRPDEFEHALVHTGQHYDDEMSAVFLEELGVGDPDYQLGIGSAPRAEQIARVVERLPAVLREVAPDVVLVPGDVNSTLGGALAAAREGIALAHVEAGLRSFDPTMPEEANRMGADALSALLFTHSPEARDNLLREGAAPEQIHEVGNTMIDTLFAMRGRIAAAAAPQRHGLEPGRYVVVTLHRPALVDDDALLIETMQHLAALADEYEVMFPVHPRTRRALERLRAQPRQEALRLTPPLGYVEFLGLVADAAAVVTDSGGLQEETTALGVPCFTLRDNTERPITVELGTNTLLGLEPARLRDVPELLRRRADVPTKQPPLWDGRASERIAGVLARADLTLKPRSRLNAAALATLRYPLVPMNVCGAAAKSSTAAS
jgi:UDP-N-acetylglucosamine 2-epimerase (non-hydrolysing)